MEGKEHIPAGGLVIGKEDIKKSFFSRKIKEKIYLITKDLHALIIGATRSGKTRNVVIETITMLILAGENVFIPDLKGEIRDYTEDTAKRCGYETICINFINPYESDRKNFLEPIVQALRRKDISRAIEETWSLVSQLVGEPPEHGDKLWNDGEAATLAASIMAVCYDNQDHPEYQNLTNVFYFITEMCSEYRGALPLQFYIDSLPEDHPAKILLAATKVAAMRTRSSFYVSAIMTLKLLTIPAINQMTNASDFDIEKLIEEGKKVIVYLCLPARDKTYFPLASLVLRQLSDQIDYLADAKYGGRIPKRWTFVDDEIGNFTKITNIDNKHHLEQEKEFVILCLFSLMHSWMMYTVKRFRRLFRIMRILKYIFAVRIQLLRRKFQKILEIIQHDLILKAVILHQEHLRKVEVMEKVLISWADLYCIQMKLESYKDLIH